MKKVLFMLVSTLYCVLHAADHSQTNQKGMSLFLDYLLEEKAVVPESIEHFGSATNMLQLLQMFDVRLFPQVTALGRLFKKEYSQKAPSCSKKESVADSIRLYLTAEESDPLDQMFRSLVYAYKKEPIILDAYKIVDGGEQTLGEYIDQNKDSKVVKHLVKAVQFVRYRDLITLLDACMVGKGDLAVFKKMVKGNEAEFLGMPFPLFPLPLGQGLAQVMAHFPKAEEILNALNPQWRNSYQPLALSPEQWKQGLTGIFQVALTTKKEVPLHMLEHLVKQLSFCADDVLITSHLDQGDDGDVDDKVEIRQSLGAFIDEHKQEPHVAQLDALLKPYRIDAKKFGRRIVDCLFEKCPVSDLKRFIDGHNGPLLLTIKFPEGPYKGKSIISVLKERNPVLFKRAPEIITLLDPKSDVRGPYTGMDQEELVRRGEQELVSWISSYLAEGKPDFDTVVFGYSHVPVCIDVYKKRGSNESIGDQVDRAKFTEWGAKIAHLTKNRRAAFLRNDKNRSALRNLLAVNLTQAQADQEKKLRDYFLNSGDQVQKVTLGNAATPFLEVTEFFKMLNPVLFPRKNRCAQILNLTPHQVRGSYSQKTDKKWIERLVAISIMHKELRPLVAYGYKNYQKVYGVFAKKGTLNLETIDYKGKSVAQYLVNSGSQDDIDFYENLFYTEAQTKDKTREKQIRPTVPLWRKGVIAVALGAGLYAGYSWFRSGKNHVSTKVA